MSAAGREIALSPKQREYLTHATCRWNVKCGAARSGKTHLDYSVVIPKRILACRGDGLIVLMGNTVGTVRRNVLEPMRRIWGKALVGRPSADGTVELFGKRCHLLGAGRADCSSRLQGAGVEYCYGDEVTTWNEDVFNMLKSRLDKPGSRFDGTCNPAGPRHWFRAFLDSGADIYLQEYTIFDNPFLPRGFVEELEREYEGTVWYDRLILGRWVAAEGLCYPQFAADEERYLCGGADRERVRFISVGVDFGGNRSRTAFCATAVEGDFERLCVVADHRVEGGKGEIDSARVCGELAGFLRRIRAAYPGVRVKYVFADNEAQYLVNGVRRALRAEFPETAVLDCAKKAIVDRMICANTLLSTGRLRISRGCALLRAGLAGAAWDTSGAKDRRRDDFTSDVDILDAFEYSFERFMDRLG